MKGDEWHTRCTPDVHDLELAAGNQFVRLCPADPEHRRCLDDRQQQSFALLDRAEMTHRGTYVHSRAESATRISMRDQRVQMEHTDLPLSLCANGAESHGQSKSSKRSRRS